MVLDLLKAKIHCATVTEANLHYMGSITIDEDLMRQVFCQTNMCMSSTTIMESALKHTLSLVHAKAAVSA